MDDLNFKVNRWKLPIFYVGERKRTPNVLCLQGKLKAQLIQVLPFMDLSQVRDTKKTLRLKTNDSH